MLNRRSFVSLLAGLPIVGNAFQLPPRKPKRIEVREDNRRIVATSRKFIGDPGIEPEMPVFLNPSGCLTAKQSEHFIGVAETVMRTRNDGVAVTVVDVRLARNTS